MSPLRSFAVGYRPRNRWLRRRIDRTRYGQLARLFAAVVLGLLGVAAAAWPRLEATRLGYRVEELRLAREELEQDVRRQRLRLAELTDPARVGALARERGLEAPEREVVIGLAPRDISGASGAAVGGAR